MMFHACIMPQHDAFQGQRSRLWASLSLIPLVFLMSSCGQTDFSKFEGLWYVVTDQNEDIYDTYVWEYPVDLEIVVAGGEGLISRQLLADGWLTIEANGAWVMTTDMLMPMGEADFLHSHCVYTGDLRLFSPTEGWGWADPTESTLQDENCNAENRRVERVCELMDDGDQMLCDELWFETVSGELEPDGRRIVTFEKARSTVPRHVEPRYPAP